MKRIDLKKQLLLTFLVSLFLAPGSRAFCIDDTITVISRVHEYTVGNARSIRVSPLHQRFSFSRYIRKIDAGPIPTELKRAFYDVEKLEVTRLPRDASIIGSLEEIMAIRFPQNAAALDYGGSKIVFEHPEDSSKVIKVLGFDKGLVPSSDTAITIDMQIELAIHNYLISKEIPLRKIDNTPELWKRGIIIQEKSGGAAIDEVDLSEVEIRNINNLIDSFREDSLIIDDIIRVRFGIIRTVLSQNIEGVGRIGRYYSNGNATGPTSLAVGVDVGHNYRNIHIQDSLPFLIDW